MVGTAACYRAVLQHSSQPTLPLLGLPSEAGPNCNLWTTSTPHTMRHLGCVLKFASDFMNQKEQLLLNVLMCFAHVTQLASMETVLPKEGTVFNQHRAPTVKYSDCWVTAWHGCHASFDPQFP